MPKHTFHLKYAPHFGSFKELAGPDPIDQLQFIADQGFTAFEENGLGTRPVEEQEKIAAEMQRLGLQMGVFSASKLMGQPKFVSADPDNRAKIEQGMRAAVETAKRLNATWCTIVPGSYDLNVEWDYQTAIAIDNLKRCAEIAEPAGLVAVIEPLNWWKNHPGMFLRKVPQAYLICRAVGSPSCKILFDIYHQQITEGNLIPNIDRAWEEIGYFHVGDTPGRKEPGTGEINYRNVFQHIHRKGWQGVLGMEHGASKPGKEGEQAVIEAYRNVDNFQA